jgi:hypothetical protein
MNVLGLWPRAKRAAAPDLGRRPTLEVHVPIAPAPSFLYQLRCLAHTLRRFGGEYRDAPVIATVGGDPVDLGLAARMPWLAANGIELRWVPARKYAALGMHATGATRLKQPFRSDVVLLLDADTLIRRPLDDLIQLVYRDRVVAGVIAQTTPLYQGRDPDMDWTRLFSLCGLSKPRLDHEHPGWGYFFWDQRYRYCPAYFNYGVIAAPADLVGRIGRVSETYLQRLRSVMASYFDGQLALMMAIAKLDLPVVALPMRYNMLNNPMAEALNYREIDHAIIVHYLSDQHFRRQETFASLSSLEAFLARTDLRVVSQMAQELVRAIFPALGAEECGAAVVA